MTSLKKEFVQLEENNNLKRISDDDIIDDIDQSTKKYILSATHY